MDGWITFWRFAYIIGLSSFFLLAIVIVPLGARDLVRLFKHLDRKTNQQPPREDGTQSNS